MQLSRQQGERLYRHSHSLHGWGELVVGKRTRGYQQYLYPLPTFIYLRRKKVTWWGGGLFPWMTGLQIRQTSVVDFRKWSKSFSIFRAGTKKGQPWLTLRLTLRRPGPRWTNLRTWRLWRKPERGGGVPGNGLNASARYRADSLESPTYSFPIYVTNQCFTGFLIPLPVIPPLHHHQRVTSPSLNEEDHVESIIRDCRRVCGAEIMSSSLLFPKMTKSAEIRYNWIPPLAQ